jgi:hypothetical protein
MVLNIWLPIFLYENQIPSWLCKDCVQRRCAMLFDIVLNWNVIFNHILHDICKAYRQTDTYTHTHTHTHNMYTLISIAYSFSMWVNPLPALTYKNVLDLNVACRAKRTQMYYWHVCKFKCPLKKKCSLPAHAVGI